MALKTMVRKVNSSMRWQEIHKLFEQGDIDAIKRMLIDKIQTADQELLLKKLLNVLESSGLDERLLKVLRTDTDAEKFGLEKIVADIMNTPGTVAEKEHFAKNYRKGFINTGVLMSGQVVSIEKLLQNQAKIDPKNDPEQTLPFVTRVFRRMLKGDYKKQGEGTGEIALAVLSPAIFKIGGGKEASGDILIKGDTNTRVEVKARGDGSPGKFADSKIYAGFNLAGPATVIKKYFPELNSTVALVQGERQRGNTTSVTGANGLVTKLDATKLPTFAKELANSLCSVLGPSFQANITKAIQSNNSQVLKNNFVKMIHDRYYQVKSKNEEEKLDGILIIDIPSNKVVMTKGMDQIYNSGGIVPPSYITGPGGKALSDIRDFAPGVRFGK